MGYGTLAQGTLEGGHDRYGGVDGARWFHVPMVASFEGFRYQDKFFHTERVYI